VIDTLYLAGTGLFYRLDPRTKLAFAASLTIYLAAESRPHMLLLALLLLHVLATLSRTTRRHIPFLWRTLATLLLMIVLLGSIRWRAPEALLAIGPLAFTVDGLWTAVGLAARIFGLSLAFSLLLWTTEPGDAVAGLVRLGLPFELGFPAIMALQYVASFRRQFQHILQAQQSRGLTFDRKNPLQMARAYIPVLVPLIITALRAVDHLSLALQSRGFISNQRRTSRRQLVLRRRDWLFLLGVWGSLIGLALV
jgi:energy-coupling factor transport system permease protein